MYMMNGIRTGLINILGCTIMVLSLMNCDNQHIHTPQNPFIGTWRLGIMEVKDAETGEWNEWRDGMQGYIMYSSDNHMAVHLTVKGYQDFEVEFPNFVDTVSLDALKHLTKSYTYFAEYEIFEDKGVVQHARISHSNPNEWRDVVRRKYTFKGDTLFLQPEEERNAMLRLKWIRVE